MISKNLAVGLIGYVVLSAATGCDLTGQSFQYPAIILPPNSTPPKLTKPTTNTGPLSDKPMSTAGVALPEKKIDLVECRAVAESVSRYKLSVKYQFLDAPPNPDFQYLISVSFSGREFAEMKIVEGKSLSSEGTIEWTYDRPGTANVKEPEFTTVKFVFSEQYERSGNQGSFIQIGQPAITTLDKSALGSEQE